ncbi:uncharacterized protein [Rutidosis leptorrhynchoides]|uniref:uncharacterized protein n=1 Tax=Rutidosis leptorrhynchoides TaxID=125765 RepID=UPI003A99C74E
MLLLSLNIRTFGSSNDSKIREFKRLIRKIKPSFIALQETKLHRVNEFWVRGIWGSNYCQILQKEMVGKSGGQLIIWDSTLFIATDSYICDHFIGVRGKWASNGAPCIFINVYGPHNDPDKIRMWDSLSAFIKKYEDEACVVCGDFNEVRNQDERLNCDFNASRARKFNDFITGNNLIDLPMGGRKFTRVSDDGLKFSKLDRFLINDHFNLMWSILSVIALERSLSDHCPIILKDIEKNFGPKPTRVFDE